MSRISRRHAKRSDAAAVALGHTLMRTPTTEEIAGELGMDLPDYYRRSRAAVLALPVGSDVDPRPLAEAIAMDRDMRPLLLDALRQLEPRWRRALLLRYYYGMSPREIAGHFGVHESRVSQLCALAKKKCRRILAAKGVRGVDDVLAGRRRMAACS